MVYIEIKETNFIQAIKEYRATMPELADIMQDIYESGEALKKCGKTPRYFFDALHGTIFVIDEEKLSSQLIKKETSENEPLISSVPPGVTLH